MNDKEIYCMGRAEYLSDTLGISLTAGYAQAEEEWSKGRTTRSRRHMDESEYDHNNMYSDSEWNSDADIGDLHNAD